jgi:hypothetical protein
MIPGNTSPQRHHPRLHNPTKRHVFIFLILQLSLPVSRFLSPAESSKPPAVALGVWIGVS